MKYFEPEMEIVEFDEDIITVSPGGTYEEGTKVPVIDGSGM